MQLVDNVLHQADDLNRLSQAHLIGKDRVLSLVVVVLQPAETFPLIRTQRLGVIRSICLYFIIFEVQN